MFTTTSARWLCCTLCFICSTKNHCQLISNLFIACLWNSHSNGTFVISQFWISLVSCRINSLKGEVQKNRELPDLRKIDFAESCGSPFFLLAAAWVDSERSALQSAEQRCQRRHGRIHRFGCTEAPAPKPVQAAEGIGYVC